MTSCDPKHFLFQIDYDFCLLTYPECLDVADHLDFKHDCLKTISSNRKGKPIQKACGVKPTIRDNKLSALIESSIEEILFIYGDATGKEYCFTKRAPYSEYLSKSASYDEAAEQAIKDLRQLDLSHWDYNNLVCQVQKLHEANWRNTPFLKDTQKLTLTDILSKKILKQT